MTRGPDGAWYVGTLAEGAGNGGANVWRIVPGHAPEVNVGGLTAVVDIAFGPDGSPYASERPGVRGQLEHPARQRQPRRPAGRPGQVVRLGR